MAHMVNRSILILSYPPQIFISSHGRTCILGICLNHNRGGRVFNKHDWIMRVKQPMSGVAVQEILRVN